MSAGVPTGWPEFDHATLGYAQVIGFNMVSGPPKAELSRALGGPDRPRVRRKNAGSVLQLQWLMTNAQVTTLRTFWVDTLNHGEYPFAMQIIVRETLEWWACRFLEDFSQEPVSTEDWTVTANLYLGYMSPWMLKPGSDPMPFQTNVSNALEPNPPGALYPVADACLGFYQGDVDNADILKAPSELIAGGGLITFDDYIFAPVGVVYLDLCPV